MSIKNKSLFKKGKVKLHTHATTTTAATTGSRASLSSFTLTSRNDDDDDEVEKEADDDDDDGEEVAFGSFHGLLCSHAPLLSTSSIALSGYVCLCV